MNNVFNIIKNKLKENKSIVRLYMKVYGNRKEKHRIDLAKKTLQNEGFQYLSQIENALSKAGASYFVNFGTLLGLLRSGSFIAWDNDLDYGIVIDDVFSWDDLGKAMRNIGMTLAHQFSCNGTITEQTYKSDTMTVDFFAHKEATDYSYEFVYFWKKGYDYKSPNDTHVSQLKMYKFSGIEEREITGRGIKVSVPVNAEKYLSSIYTDEWIHPNPNWVSEKGPAWNEIPGVIGHAEYF